ncbi:hypothetical protein C8R45DRAFT_1005918 [Mycena sanguinolenta]|nr:hypothetical protein C8R45DRAFT_1005918 [Mycena sanguinolenta]
MQTTRCMTARLMVLGVGVCHCASGIMLWLGRRAAECAMDERESSTARRLPFRSCFFPFLLAFSPFSSSLSFPRSHPQMR